MLLGLIICCLAAATATFLASVQHIIGAPIIGLFLGILLVNCMPTKFLDCSRAGAAFSSKRILRIGVILAGGTLNFHAILDTGTNALPLVIGAILIAFLASYLIGRAMGIPVNTRLLVGGGTSICGGTAIATLSAVIEAKEDETAYAMTSIFLFDILAALLWPYAAVGLHFSPKQFGLLGGVAINDVSSVTAAGDTFNALMGTAAWNSVGVSGGDLAMIVKLTRVAMLVVVAIVMTVVHQMQLHKDESAAASDVSQSVAGNIIKSFPFYVLGFLALAVVNTLMDFKAISMMGTTLSALLSSAYKYLFAMALVGVGYKIKLKELFTKGVQPVLLGGCTWLAVSVVTLSYAYFLG